MVRMKSIFAIAGLAKSLAEPLSSQREVAVALSPDDGASVVELIDEVEQGAKVSLVFDGLVFAQVPLEAVSELDVSESLNCMSRQAELSPAHSALAAAGRPSDGVRSVQADRLHAEGFTGKGVKVGILDLGFARYGALHNQGLVPAPVGGRVGSRHAGSGAGAAGSGCWGQRASRGSTSLREE